MKNSPASFFAYDIQASRSTPFLWSDSTPVQSDGTIHGLNRNNLTMNAPFDPSIHYSVSWPPADAFRPPAHALAILDRAKSRLAQSASTAAADDLLGAPHNKGRQLLHSAIKTVEADLAKLTSPTTRVVFIGNVGIGKTTAICLLSNLTRSDDEARAYRQKRMTAGLGAAKKAILALKDKKAIATLTAKETVKLARLEAKYAQDLADSAAPIGPTDADRLLLPAAEGRTTICPTEIRYAPEPYVVVTPYEQKKLVQTVIDVAAEAFALRHAAETVASADNPIAAETTRGIRNMAGLTLADFKQLVESADSPQALARSLIIAMRLEHRSKTQFAPDPHEPAAAWLATTISNLNYCKDPEAPFPAAIRIYWPGAPQAAHIVDTRGLDGYVTAPLRAELENDDAVVVLCSSFQSIPDASTIAALRHAVTMGRRSGFVMLGLSHSSGLAISSNVDEEEEPEERKAREAGARLAQERLPIVPVVAGPVPLQAPMIVEAIGDAITAIRRAQAADLARHVEILVEASKVDHGAILDELARLQATHIALVANAPCTPDLPYDARLLTFEDLPHASALAAMVRRRGIYENLNAAEIATHTFVARIGAAAETVAKRLMRETTGARSIPASPPQDAAVQIARDRIQAFRRSVRTNIRDALVEMVAEALAATQADDIIDLCRRAYGPGSQDVRGKEKYRQFVIRHLDHWMTDDQELGAALGNHALAMWQRAVDALVRHEDAYSENIAISAR